MGWQGMGGTHISVLQAATVAQLLAGRTHGCFVDATFGRGGHARALLAQLDAGSRLYAFDKDPDAQAVGRALMQVDPRLVMVHASFARLQDELAACGVVQVDGIMADLGVSSPQLDQAERGFSFMHDGPLDMRMDNSQGPTAAELLMQWSESELADVLYQYGEERHSRRIARAIKQHLATKGPITRTLALAELIRAAHPRWEKHKHPATRSFQAIRIAVNAELADLDAFLQQTLGVMRPGGRLAVISFHSLEDRQVKQFMQKNAQHQHDGWGPAPAAAPLRRVARIAPDALEVAANPRARSAWLRVAERVADPGAMHRNAVVVEGA